MTVPAGWYPDPSNHELMRYWDGSGWTGHVHQPADASQPSQEGSATPGTGGPAHVANAPSSNGSPRGTRQADRSRGKIGFFSGKRVAEELSEENAQLRDQIAQMGGLELADIRRETSAAAKELQKIGGEAQQHREELDRLRLQILDVRDSISVQELGLYDFEHPAEASAALADELADVRAKIKRSVKERTATRSTSNFTFNNSAAKGRKFIKDMSTMLLSAYNAEAENGVKSVRAGGLEAARKRLDRAVARVESNGQMIDLRIAPSFHRLRLRELELAARHLEAVKQEKEAERERRAELREQKKAEAEMKRERERLEKEREHYRNAIAALNARGDAAGVSDLEAKLADVDRAIDDVDYRAANIRAGYVYVISNLGAFGDRVVKIGMTRRLEPMDRVRELGDASVPFRFDVHAMFFAQDAVGIEAMLHREFADRRLNQVNTRREFFYCTPQEVLEKLRAHSIAVVEYRTEAEAEEFRLSTAMREREPV